MTTERRPDAAASAGAYPGAAAIPQDIDWSGDLPVLAVRDELIAAVRAHQVVIVAGETGSGKTTQLPKICLAAGRGRAGMIGHTQPRRIAARAVASRIAEELKTQVGAGVGFKVRFSDQTAAQTYLKLMTDGVLLAELGQDRLLRAYDTIIIDEAHERSLNIDFLLGYLRTLLAKRPDLKLLITSATIDVERFSRHFAGAPVFVVEGRSYPVETRYRPVSLEAAASSEDEGFDLIEEAIPRAVVDAVEECLQHERAQGRSARGDILVFSSSEREIRLLADTLRKYGPPHTEILPLYSRLSVAEQQKVFERGGGRRIVIATNVAETSLTVPNIHYVIDPGFARISRYSYRSKVQRLPVEAVSQASANQRAGRCGRIAPGVCIRLYSEADYLARPEFTDPEIRRTNLAAVILQMQVLGLGDLERFPFLDAPDSRLVNDGFRLLEELGAVDRQRRITTLGRQIARLPLDPRLARMVVAAAPLGALHEVLVIVAALSVQDPRDRPHDKQQAADERHAQFRHPDSDFLFFVNLWAVLAAQKGELTERERREFARKHFLSWLRLREWRETWRQLVQLCEGLKLPMNREPAPYEAVHRALLTGLLSQIAHKGDDREYQAPRNQKALVFPGSVLARKGPPWIMAAELVETHRVYLRLAAKIEPEWAEKLAGDLLKRSYSEPHWERRQGRVVAFEQTSLFGLVLHARRKVNYEPINRAEAREIFIRDALVAGDIDLKAAFFRHNRELIAEVERLEDKTRRRDLLVDEETLYAFYDERVPEDVASLKTFEDWRHRIEKEQPGHLCLSREQVLAKAADDGTAHDFPDTLRVAGHDLPLRYHFEPGHEADGVTLLLPAGLVQEVPEAVLEWLVPGLLGDRVEALLRGLPKALRRQLVPLPDTVASVLQELEPQMPGAQQGRPQGPGGKAPESLLAALGQALLRRGVRVGASDWAGIELPDHCRMNVRVMGEGRQALAEGRDLGRLRVELAKQPGATASADRQTRQQWERVGITRWDFPDLPDVIESRQQGMPARAYPALVRTPQGLALKLLGSREEARAAHHTGVAELIRLQCAQEMKTLKKAMGDSKGLFLHASAWLAREHLETDFGLSATKSLLGTPEALPYTLASYDRAVTNLRGRLVPEGLPLLQQLAQIYAVAHRIRARLAEFRSPVFTVALADIRSQLDGLDLSGFLASQTADRWLQYPRYLKALELRLDKLGNNILRDDKASAEVQRHWQRWQRHVQQVMARGGDPGSCDEYRWLLEEYRISLFSQPLKTAVPVSAERLDRLWSQLTD